MRLLCRLGLHRLHLTPEPEPVGLRCQRCGKTLWERTDQSGSAVLPPGLDLTVLPSLLHGETT